ncbi:hypothetical protein [Rathayibacter sp. VKM Ac-2857]|uniref:hypothetical protein n=1 Tax=Rathayibacter sp. VKM Ac-2857 TaxID=2739020 RepID=UPI001563BC3E|nr:hypothetical protein [Rathayibacter sp. VKM Ac-2857]NQX15248.1 hypothetical protein [Rathayibacter sp. VKM Ac-2857]
MTGNSEAETTRMPTTGDGTEPTREYVWPEPEPGGRRPATGATAVQEQQPASASTSPLGSVEPEPEPARRKGNRLAGLAIALLTTAVFAALYLVALTATRLLIDAVEGDPVTVALEQGPTAVFLLPVVAFFVGLALIVLAVNRAGWWAYVLGGFFVALLAGAAAVVGAWSAVGGFAVPQDRAAVVDFLRDPATLIAVAAAAVLAREVSVWGGSLIAGRARGVKRRNAERDAAAQS